MILTEASKYFKENTEIVATSNGYDGLAGAYQIIAESVADDRNLMSAVYQTEALITAYGEREALTEANVLKSFIAKAKEMFDKIISKIKELWDNLVAFIRARMASDKTFVEKYRSALEEKAKSLGSKFEYEGYKWGMKNFDSISNDSALSDALKNNKYMKQVDELNKLLGTGDISAKVTDVMDTIKNVSKQDIEAEVATDIVGRRVSTRENMITVLREALYGTTAKDKTTIKGFSHVGVKEMFDVISNRKNDLQTCKNAEKELVSARNDIIGKLEDFDKLAKEDNSGTADKRLAAAKAALSYYKEVAGIIVNLYATKSGMVSSAIKDRANEFRRVLGSFVAYNPKSTQNASFEVDENAGGVLSYFM